MARIRSLKPEFWDDRKLARSTSRDARMLYMGLWNQADEHCRLNGDELWLKGRVFPYDDDIQPDDVTAMLDQLEDAGRVQRYVVDGDPFIFLPKLGKHQRLEPAKVESRHPAPPTDTDAHQSAPRANESARDSESSALLYVAGSMEPVAREGLAQNAPRELAVVEPASTAQTIVAEWIDRCAERPPEKVIGPLAKFIGQMLGEGINPDHIRRGVAIWMTRDVHPSVLPSIVNGVMNAPASSKPRAQQETDDLFDRAARRMGVTS